MTHDDAIRFACLFDKMATVSHTNSREHGFWDIIGKIRGIESAGHMDHKTLTELELLFRLSRIALFHSEASECLEGIRKGLPDDHLPSRSMESAELADIVIRILDYAGGFNIPLGEIILEKMAYNAKRPYMHGKKA